MEKSHQLFVSGKLPCRALVLTFILFSSFHFEDIAVSASPRHEREQHQHSLKVEKFIQSLRSKSVVSSSLQDIFQSEILSENDQQRYFLLPGAFLSDAQSQSQRQTSTFIQGDSEIPLPAGVKVGVGVEPDVKRDVVQLIASKGYPAQEYTVQTKDGFLLTVQRIPHGRNGTIAGDFFRNENDDKNSTDPTGSRTGTRPPVFLQHGLLSSAADWVLNLANESLAFVLADNGYDVWLGNSRGNTYSQRHVTLMPDEDAFWDWSFDEMAQYDIPACIDFILNKTGESSLYYVGHSQGTIIAFAGFSSMPDEYQKKIRLFVGLAPVITLNHIVSPIKYLSLLTDAEAYILFGRKSFLENNFLIKYFGDTLCDQTATKWVCSNIVFVLCGYDTANLNTTRLPVYINHTPAGTSAKNMIHYAQFVRSKTFAKYDFDSPTENVKHYNQTTPPVYEPGQFKIPSLLFTASNDWLADPKDVQILESTLPNVVANYNVPEWNHLDFVWGLNAASKCYENILKWLPKY